MVSIGLSGVSQAAEQQKLPNSVTCVYDAMSPEQREIAQALFMQAMAQGTEKGAQEGVFKEFDALIRDAHNACLDLYPWTSGKSENATNYAMATLLVESTRPAMTEHGFAYADIDGYIDANRAQLVTARPPSEAMLAALRTYLGGKGWSEEKIGEVDNIRGYFTMELLREQFRKSFALGLIFQPYHP